MIQGLCREYIDFRGMEKLSGKVYYQEPNLLQEAFYQYPIHSRKIKYAVSFHQLKFDEASRGMNSLEEEHTQMMDIKRKSVYQFIIMVL